MMSFNRLCLFCESHHHANDEGAPTEVKKPFRNLRDRFAVYADAETLANSLAEMICQEVNTAAELNRPFHLAVSGGSTPNLLFALLKKRELKGELNPAQLHLWWVDERMVPSSDAQSNYGNVCMLWLEKSRMPLVRIHPIINEIEGEELTGSLLAEHCRNHYERELDKLELNAEGVPVFDLILLGIGDDGHTASLFPDTKDENRWVQTSVHPESGQHRVGLGYPVLEHSENVCFLVNGRGKQDILFNLLREKSASPAARVFRNNKTALVLADEAAVKKIALDQEER